MKRRILNTAILSVLLSALALSQDVASFAKRITVKKLPNGLTLIVCERPEAPVFSFFHTGGRRLGAGSPRPDRNGPYVRAHGIQGH